MIVDQNRGDWRVIIIGGGPAAALQIQRLRTAGVAPSDVLIVSDRWGAPGMAFLGTSRLQSYAHELDLHSGVESPLSQPGFIQPTGTEFHLYAQKSLENSGAVLRTGTVTELWHDTAGFGVRARTGDGDREFRAPNVVLATGTRPRQPPTWLTELGARTYDQVYLDIQAGRTDPYAGRSAYVVGSGNSAMQTASLLASVSRSVVVLAARYLGMYPSETLDRFAWRASSQLTYELVVKSSHQDRICAGESVCVRFVVYQALDVRDGRFVVRARTQENASQLGHHSDPALHRHVAATEVDGGWQESVPVAASAIVWATGCEPVYPNSDLIAALPKDADGYVIADDRGQTTIPGLFVTGACAGRRAVNEMVPAQAVTAT